MEQTRAIIQALKLGLRVLMLDMDASPNGPALRPDNLLQDNDLVYVGATAACSRIRLCGHVHVLASVFSQSKPLLSPAFDDHARSLCSASNAVAAATTRATASCTR